MLVGGVSGNAADCGLIAVGDTLTYVGDEAVRDMTRVEGQVGRLFQSVITSTPPTKQRTH